MFSSRFAVDFEQYIDARCLVENEDVVGAAPKGDAPTTSEWSTILPPTKVRPISDAWGYISLMMMGSRMYTLASNIYVTECIHKIMPVCKI